MWTLAGRLLVGIVSIAFLCCGQEKDAAALKKEASIRELLGVTSAQSAAKEVMERMKTALEQQMPADFDRFWSGFSSEVDFNELNDKLIPVYAKYLTQEDVDGIL